MTRSNKLGRPPLILERGFQGWYLTYPQFTKRIVDFRQLDNDETRFGHLLSEALKNVRVDVDYPDLEAKRPTTTLTSRDERKASLTTPPMTATPSSRASSTSSPTPMLRMEESTHSAPPLSSMTRNASTSTMEQRHYRHRAQQDDDSPSATTTSMANSQRPHYASASIPSVDRSTKPPAPFTVATGRPAPFPVEAPTTTFPVLDRENDVPPRSTTENGGFGNNYVMKSYGKDDIVELSSATTKRFSSLPAVQTLGGARIAAAPPASAQQHQE